MASTATQNASTRYSQIWIDQPASLPFQDSINLIKEDKEKWKKEKTAFLIDYDWFEGYVDFIYGEGDNPGPITQWRLLDEKNELKHSLEESIDYSIVSASLWHMLVEWFGLEGLAIERKVLLVGLAAEQKPFVDIYPINFTLHVLFDPINGENTSYSPLYQIDEPYHSDEPYAFSFSRSDTLRSLYKQVMEAFQISDGTSFRLWYLNKSNLSSRFVSLSEFNDQPAIALLSEYAVCMTIFEIDIADGSLLLEFQHPNGEWLSDSITKEQNLTINKEIGLCGLYNLGNSCYMNSALQCMIHTHELTKYFLSDSYEKDINYNNPLGMMGKVALSYASLLKMIHHTADMHSVSPSSFKFIIGEFNTYFSGYRQQDSQEFIAFFLDGLHEDLNRIQIKPYFERPDLFDEHPLHVQRVANQCWDIHTKRNDSIIVQLFQGMYKSTLECSICYQKSTAFDPFMYLTLPLPTSAKWRHKVVYVPPFGTQSPVELYLELPMESTVIQMKFQATEKLQKMGLECGELTACDIYRGKVYKVLKNKDKISKKIHKWDHVVLYGSTANGLTIPIVHGCKRPAMPGSYQSNDVFGFPLQLNVRSRNVLTNDLVKEIVELYRVYAGIDVAIGTLQLGLKRMESKVGKWECIKEIEVKRFEIVEEEEIVIDDKTVIMCLWNDQQYEKLFYNCEWIFEKIQFHMESITLEDCLLEFSKPEQLDLQDSWYCPGCKAFRPATKRLEIWRLPKILVIHLNRFSGHGGDLRRRRKRRDLVVYPVFDLNMKQFLSPFIKDHEWLSSQKSMLYDLYAVDNHHGFMSNGHYTAYARDASSQTFFKFDDTAICEIDPEDIVTSSAYVLFYRAKN